MGSPQTAVDYDQMRFLGFNQSNPNADFGQLLRYQDPMALRLGLEFGF